MESVKYEVFDGYDSVAQDLVIYLTSDNVYTKVNRGLHYLEDTSEDFVFDVLNNIDTPDIGKLSMKLLRRP